MPQATMFAEWCDPCQRSKGSWLLRARLELRFTSLAQHIALAPRSARREHGVAHTNEMICTISSAGHVFKRVLWKSRRNPWKGSSGVPRVTLTWLTGQSDNGKESRNASSSHCASITLAYPYTHTHGLSPCLWVSLVGVRGGWGMLGSNLFTKLWGLLKLKNRKHKQLKKLNQNIW